MTSYPFIEKVETFDDGAALGVVVRLDAANVRAVRIPAGLVLSLPCTAIASKIEEPA